jgi:prevent-host-death family protein
MEEETLKDKTIPITLFKARCLKLLDMVAKSGVPLLVTKRGKPLVRVLPAEPVPSLRGSVTYLVSDEEFIAPLDEHWDVES